MKLNYGKAISTVDNIPNKKNHLFFIKSNLSNRWLGEHSRRDSSTQEREREREQNIVLTAYLDSQEGVPFKEEFEETCVRYGNQTRERRREVWIGWP